MSRVRLTARGRSAADQQPPYPGNVNQPDRKDPAWDEYHTFEQQVNHELPDMRHQWQDDERDDIGFGVPEAWGRSPTVASVRTAATKAVRIAVLLLGDKVSDDVIEAQARDMMVMSPQAMDRTLQRFADTQKLYAEDAEKEDDDEEPVAKKSADESEKKDDEKKEEPVAKKGATEEQFKPKVEKPGSDEQPKAKCGADDEKKDDDKKAADEKDEKKDDKKSCNAADEKDEKKDDKKAADESKDEKDDKKAADESKDEKDEKDDKKAADESDKKDDEKADDKKASTVRRGSTELDIELSASADGEDEPDPEADERLASLLEDPMAVAAEKLGTSDRKVEASQKAGIKKLGGQPRVASAEGAADISSIWQSAPDVSEAFK